MADIEVITPDGQVGRVAEEELPRARAAGLRRTEVPMVTPDGQKGFVPYDQVDGARNAGLTFVDPLDVPEAGEATGPERIAMVKPDGSQVAVLAERADRALAHGYKTVEQAAQEAQDEREYGDATGLLQTAGEGISRGVTLGFDAPMAYAQSGLEYLGNKAFEALHPGRPAVSFDQTLQENKADIAKRQEVNKTTAIGGEVFGGLTTALATGGTSTLAKGAAYTPAALLARGSAALAERVVPKALTTFGATIGRMVLSGAAEGAAYGAAHEVNQAYLAGDYEGVTQKAFVGAGVGALVGAGTSALFGAAGEGLKKLVTPKPQTIAEASLDSANALTPDAPVGAMTPDEAVLKEVGFKSNGEILGEIQFGQTPEQAGLVNKLKTMSKEATAAQDFEKLHDATTRKVAANGNELARIKDKLDAYLNKSNKTQAVKDMLDESGVVWSPQNADEVLTSLSTIKGAMAGFRENGVLLTKQESNAIKAVMEAVEDVEKHVTGIKGMGPISPTSRVLRADNDAIAETFMALDTLKTRIGNLARNAGRNSETLTRSEALLQREYMGLRSHLQDPKVWGERVAEMQTITNAAEAEGILKGRVFQNRFVQAEAVQGERSSQFGFDTLNAIDSGKVGSMLRNLGKAENAEAERDFVVGLQRMVDWQKAKAQYYRVPDELRQELARADGLVQGLVQDFHTLRGVKAIADEYQASLNHLKDLSLLGTNVATLRATATVATSVPRRIAQAFKGSKPAAAPSLVESAVKAQTAVNDAAKAVGRFEKVRKAVGATRKPITYESIKGILENMQKAVTPGTQENQDLQSYLLDVEHQAGPEVAQAMAMQLQKQSAFLAEKFGEDGNSGLFDDVDARDPVTLRRMQRYVEVAQDPIAGIERLAAGKWSSEDVETLQALYPRIYNEFRKKALDELAKLKERPSYAQRVKLSMALDIPVDKTMDPQYLASLQASALAGNSPEMREQMGLTPHPGKTPKVSDRFGSKADSLSYMT